MNPFVDSNRDASSNSEESPAMRLFIPTEDLRRHGNPPSILPENLIDRGAYSPL